MQTNFSAEQLRDPDIRVSNDILRKCVHCGFCTATCPTYVLLGDELDSPRGRIYLMKEMLESGAPATQRVVKHVDRCLSCLSCMTTCPASVDYMHLVDHARAHIHKTYRRPLLDRVIRATLATVLPNPNRFYASLRLALLARPFAPVLKVIPALKPLAAMLEAAPRVSGEARGSEHIEVFPAVGERTGRVALLTGCVQPVLGPEINEATVRLLNRLGVEVVTPRDQACCGALVHHMGREAASNEAARRNIDAWMREVDGEGLDAVVINASGCGTTVKDYGHMLRQDPAYAGKAERIAGLTLDITEFLDTLKPPEVRDGPALKVAYHSACSMQHGQKIRDLPKRLLALAGYDVVDVPEGYLCCGSAGVYNILQSDIADRLRQRKLANIESVAPDLVATGNIGCITQLRRGSTVPVVHTVELLDWAGGGPKPAALDSR